MPEESPNVSEPSHNPSRQRPSDGRTSPAVGIVSSSGDLEKKRRRMFARRVRQSLSVQVGALLILALAVLSIGAPLFTGLDPTDIDAYQISKPPSAGHPFGHDHMGRDLLSRVLYGSRVTFAVGLEVAALTTVTGVILGTLAGYFPRLDNPIMRFLDILMAFPSLLLAMAILAVLGPQFSNLVIALVIPLTPRAARVLRASVLEQREMDYFVAARAVGVGDLRIILRHLLPNCMAPLLVQQTYILAVAMLNESALSFLGIGLPPSIPTLGSILNGARPWLRAAPWMSLYPGLFITFMVLGFNILGDGLRDVLDPRTTER